GSAFGVSHLATLRRSRAIFAAGVAGGRDRCRPHRPGLALALAGAHRKNERGVMAEVIIVSEPAEAGALVADEIARLIARKPDAVLGLATGSTPLPVYEALPARLAGRDISRVRGFALDEYVGLDPAHPESYRSVIDRD